MCILFFASTPRVAALITNRARVVESDAETLRTLAAVVAQHDVLTHTRWVEVLGRDALTGRFYRALERAVGTIAASSVCGSDDTRGELALLDSSRLLFLAFLEAKGWLRGDRAFLSHCFDRCMESGGRFRQTVLRPLFFGTLNTPTRQRAAAARAFGRIPFLNGGLFARTALERAKTFSDLPRGRAFWYENANGLAEIAVNLGRADHALGLAIGSPIMIAS